jgi:hypothetical protein
LNTNSRGLRSKDISFGVALGTHRSFEGEKIRLLKSGSREGVIETIHTFHSLGYAEMINSISQLQLNFDTLDIRLEFRRLLVNQFWKFSLNS